MDSCASRFLDSVDIYGFVRTLRMFGHIYDIGRENEFIYWFREWFIDKVNIIIMDDNYIGNDSNNVNGFKIDRYCLDTCSAYNN
jgi:hypothetical protein